MKSLIVKRSVVLEGHKTSVSLEEAFWRGLKDIASASISTANAATFRRPYGCSYPITIRRKQREPVEFDMRKPRPGRPGLNGQKAGRDD